MLSMPERQPPGGENQLAVLTALHDVISPIDPSSLQGEALGDFAVFATSIHTVDDMQSVGTQEDYLAVATNMAYAKIRLHMEHQVHLTDTYPQTAQQLATLYERLLGVYQQRGMDGAQADHQAAQNIQEMTLTHLEKFLPESLQDRSRLERITILTDQITQAIQNPLDAQPQEGIPQAISEFLEEKLRETILLQKLPTLSQPQDTPEFQALVDAKFTRMKHMYTIPGYFETSQAVEVVFHAQALMHADEGKDSIDTAYLAYNEMHATLVPEEDTDFIP
jgi:hypothetical protein